MKRSSHSPRFRYKCIAVPTAVLAGAVLIAPVRAQSSRPSESSPRPMTRVSDDSGKSAELQEAIHRGLEWLARRQEKDGSFGADSQ